jgi:hypothetical protein
MSLIIPVALAAHHALNLVRGNRTSCAGLGLSTYPCPLSVVFTWLGKLFCKIGQQRTDFITNTASQAQLQKRSTVCLLELFQIVHGYGFKQKFDVPVSCDSCPKGFRGNNSNSAPLLSNVSSETILRAFCCLFINNEPVVQNFFPDDVMLNSKKCVGWETVSFTTRTLLHRYS